MMNLEIIWCISCEQGACGTQCRFRARSPYADECDREIVVLSGQLFTMMAYLGEKYNNRKPAIGVLFETE